jgi:hypothetical protein
MTKIKKNNKLKIVNAIGLYVKNNTFSILIYNILFISLVFFFIALNSLDTKTRINIDINSTVEKALNNFEINNFYLINSLDRKIFFKNVHDSYYIKSKVKEFFSNYIKNLEEEITKNIKNTSYKIEGNKIILLVPDNINITEYEKKIKLSITLVENQMAKELSKILIQQCYEINEKVCAQLENYFYLDILEKIKPLNNFYISKKYFNYNKIKQYTKILYIYLSVLFSGFVFFKIIFYIKKKSKNFTQTTLL